MACDHQSVVILPDAAPACDCDLGCCRLLLVDLLQHGNQSLLSHLHTATWQSTPQSTPRSTPWSTGVAHLFCDLAPLCKLQDKVFDALCLGGLDQRNARHCDSGEAVKQWVWAPKTTHVVRAQRAAIRRQAWPAAVPLQRAAAPPAAPPAPGMGHHRPVFGSLIGGGRPDHTCGTPARHHIET